MKQSFKILWVILRMYLIGMLLMVLAEPWMVYPVPGEHGQDWALPGGAEEVNFESADGTRLHGRWFPHPEPKLSMMFCHGNGECVANLSDEMQYLSRTYQASVFTFDYRGYGKSEGHPHRIGVLQDAEAAINWLVGQSTTSAEDVVLIGRSLGGAVAVDVATRHNSKSIVLISAFSKAADVAAARFPFLPVRWLMRNQYDPETAIASYQGNLLQFHGRDDRVVPLNLGRQLHNACHSRNKAFHELHHRGHNDVTLVDLESRLKPFLKLLWPKRSKVTEETPEMLQALENSLIYPAPKYPEGDWQPAGLGQEDVFFQSGDGTRLHGWFVGLPSPRAYLLHSHGNGEHVAYQAELLRFLRDQMQLAVFAWDYRGYGRSAGSPNEVGILQDAEAAHDWLMRRSGLSANRLVLVGRSLGGAVALDLAVSRGARGLILESTFTSIPELAAHHYRWIPQNLIRTKFNSLEKIGRFHGPLLISHSPHDEIIPFEMGQRLAEACPQATFIQLKTGGHNESPGREYFAQFARFVEDLK